MKKYICSICILFFLMVTSVSAQKEVSDFKRSEVRAGAGLWSSNDLISSYSDLLSNVFSGGMYSVSNERMSGNYALTYRYALTRRWSVGASFTYSNLKTDINLGKTDTGTSENNYFTIAPEVEYKYINSKMFRMYGFVGAGLTFNRQKVTAGSESATDNSPYFNFQVSPLCLQVGENFGIYLEGGFGYKGMVNLGLFARF